MITTDLHYNRDFPWLYHFDDLYNHIMSVRRYYLWIIEFHYYEPFRPTTLTIPPWVGKYPNGEWIFTFSVRCGWQTDRILFFIQVQSPWSEVSSTVEHSLRMSSFQQKVYSEFISNHPHCQQMELMSLPIHHSTHQSHTYLDSDTIGLCQSKPILWSYDIGFRSKWIGSLGEGDLLFRVNK